MNTKKNTDIDAVPIQAKTRVPREKGQAGASVRMAKYPVSESTSIPKKTALRRSNTPTAQESGVACDLLNDLGSLPRSYGEEVLFLVAQDPHWLFT